MVGDLWHWHVVAGLPVVLALAWVASRLLGARRAWWLTLTAGVVGAATGGAVAAVIARAHHSHAGFTRNAWLFSVLFTMSAIVWLEMLVRPGALAAAQTGVIRVPRPLHAIKNRWQRLRRYAEITRIATKHGLAPALGLRSRGSDEPSRTPAAVRLRLALEDCGGMFVKLGQVLSTRSDLLPDSVTGELSTLQDRVAPADPNAVAALLEAELGAPVDRVFASFDWEPIAAASIGQAYRAVLHDGSEVVVKVQRPNIAESVLRDIDVLEQLARLIEQRTSWGRDYQVLEFAAEFDERLREELDFRLEARTAKEIARNLGSDSTVYVPKVYDELTTPRVLVMEWLDGIGGRDSGGIDELGVDRRKLADELLRCMLEQMLTHGRFHADPHPGNVLVLADGHLGLIDYGAAGRLDPLQQAAIRELLVSVSRIDASAMRQAVMSMATARGDLDDDQLERALARFTARHLSPGSAPSAAMFNELLQLCFTFGLRLAPELSTFFRSLITLEGTLRTLCPGYLAIESAQQMAEEWFRARLTPTTAEQMAKDEMLRLLPVLRRLPTHVERLATQLERGQLTTRVTLFSDPGEVRVLTRLINRVVLGFIGCMVALLSVVLLSIKGGPAFTGDTSLYQFFGYFGLFCGSVVILRVLVAVLHDGLN